MIRSIAFLPRRLRGGTAVVRGLPCVSACVWVAGPRSQGFVWVHSALSEGTSPLLSRWCVAAASLGLSPPSVAHSNMNELQSEKIIFPCEVMNTTYIYKVFYVFVVLDSLGWICLSL